MYLSWVFILFLNRKLKKDILPVPEERVGVTDDVIWPEVTVSEVETREIRRFDVVVADVVADVVSFEVVAFAVVVVANVVVIIGCALKSS